MSLCLKTFVGIFGQLIAIFEQSQNIDENGLAGWISMDWMSAQMRLGRIAVGLIEDRVGHINLVVGS